MSQAADQNKKPVPLSVEYQTYPQLHFRLERHGALVAVDGLDVGVFALYVLSDVREGVPVEVTHPALVVPLTVVPASQNRDKQLLKRRSVKHNECNMIIMI